MNDVEKKPETPAGPPTRFDLLIRFLGTTGGTALITVVVGGMLGNWLTATIQAGNRVRDERLSALRVRAEQGIEMHRRYAEDGLAVLTKAYDLLGTALAAAEDVLLISGDPVWRPENYPEPDAGRIREQRRAIREAFTKAAGRWESEHKTIGLQLDYYFGSEDDSVRVAWGRTSDAMDGYLHCVYRAYAHPDDQAREDPGCARHQADAEDALRTLSVTLRERRVYLWKGWEADLGLGEEGGG